MDFSVRDFKLIKDSVNQAIHSIYPEAPPISIKALNVKACFTVIADLARFCIGRDESFHNIRKKVKGTIYEDIPNLEEVTKRIKILLFRDLDIITVYFYPRYYGEKALHEEYENVAKKILRVNVNVTNPNDSTFRVVTQLTSKILNGDLEPGLSVGKFENHIEIARVMGKTSVLLPLFHHATHSSCEKEESDLTFTKFRLFHVMIKRNFREYGEKLIDRQKAGVNNNTVRVFFYLVHVVYRMHLRMFHGEITLDNFYYKPITSISEVSVAGVKKHFFTGGKRVFISGFHYAHKKVDLKKQYFLCKDKPSLFSGYEAIKKMIEGNKCNESREGLPSDIWGLGCSLYKFLTSSYPDFALYASYAPRFNYLCHLLVNQNETMFESESSESEDFTSATVEFATRFNLKEIKRDWLISATLVDLEWMLELCDVISGLLKELDPDCMGDICQESQKSQILVIGKLIDDACEYMEEKLLNEDNVFMFLKPEIQPTYDQVCPTILKLKDQYLSVMYATEKKLYVQTEDDNPLIKLIQMMMHPDPSKRITAKAAYIYLKKHYPTVYKSLIEKNSIKPLKQPIVHKIHFKRRHSVG
jgi:hypothetical protein